MCSSVLRCHSANPNCGSGPGKFYKVPRKIGFFDLTFRIKIVTIYKNLFSDHDVHDYFLYNFFKSVINRKEPELQFVISAPAPGGNFLKNFGSCSTTLALLLLALNINYRTGIKGTQA
jgi:hypothetical protein